MSFAIIGQGLLLGFSIAAPVGPIGLLCIHRSMNDGQRQGLATGLGAATADALYGAVAALGMTTVSHWLVAERRGLGVIGGAYLLFLAFRTLTESPRRDVADRTSARNTITAYASTFVLTLMNPMTILSFIAVFAGLGLTVASQHGAALLFVAGVFCGSALWWLLLSWLAAHLGRRIGAPFIRTVNALGGLVILGFGGFAIWTSLRA